MENFKKLIQLSPNDNVLVVCQDIAAGDNLTFNKVHYLMEKNIALGHKIASRDISEGEKIIKFNVSIGSASGLIKKGEHVHIHNMKSDFIPTYIIEEQKDEIK